MRLVLIAALLALTACAAPGQGGIDPDLAAAAFLSGYTGAAARTPPTTICTSGPSGDLICTTN
jgi:hypothetical protein